MKVRLYCFFITCWLALIVAPVSASSDILKEAKNTYKQICSHCHGIDMINPGTSSYDLRKWPRDDRAGFIDSVKNGKGDMPAWGDILTAEEIEQLWYYVSTRGGKQPFPKDETIQKSQSIKRSKKLARFVQSNESQDKKNIKDTLTVCLDRKGGVMSGLRNIGGGTGLDYFLSKAIADELSYKLKVVWFEGEQDERGDPIREALAMLASGLCDVIPSFPLNETSVRPRVGERFFIPHLVGEPYDRGPVEFVNLQPISVSKPYIRIEMGIVLRSGVKEKSIHNLADLDGYKVGVEQDTLPSILISVHGTKKMLANTLTFNPGPAFLWKMEQGIFEAALVTTTAFDTHRRSYKITKLKMTDYRHPLGLNLAYIGLKSNQSLVDKISDVLSSFLSQGMIEKFAFKNGIHFTPPKKPYVQRRLTLSDLKMIK